jgi:DNA-binding transcriptional LysR family regulator
LEAAFAPRRLPLRMRIESSDVALLLDFASRGMGVAVLPDDSVYAYSGPVFAVRRGARSPLGGSHAAYSRGDAEPPVSELVKRLAQYSPLA